MRQRARCIAAREHGCQTLNSQPAPAEVLRRKLVPVGPEKLNRLVQTATRLKLAVDQTGLSLQLPKVSCRTFSRVEAAVAGVPVLAVGS